MGSDTVPMMPDPTWQDRFAYALGRGAQTHSLAGLLGGLLDNSGPAMENERARSAYLQNQLGGLDLQNSLQRAAAAGYVPGRSPAANIGSAIAAPQPTGPVQPTGGLLGTPNAQPGGLLDMPLTPLPSPSGGPPIMTPFLDPNGRGRPPGAPPVATPAPLPGANGFALSPTTMLDLVRQSWGPSASKSIPAYVSAIETMLKNGTGVRNDGSIDVLPGNEQAATRNAFATQYGQTTAKNNQNEVVGPGAALVRGPTSLDQSPGSARVAFTNPNPAQQNIINMPGAQPFFNGLGEKLGNEAFGVLQGGDTATKQLQIAQAQRDLLALHKAGGGSQGVTEPMKVQTTAILQSLGLDPSALGLPKDAGPAQALDALSKKQALGNIGGEGGLPANNFSEADRKFVQSMQNSLGDTPAGWEAKTLIGERVAQRSIEAQNSLSQAVYGGAPETAPQRYLQWKTQWNANTAMRPLFSAEDKAKLEALAKLAPKAASAGGGGQPTVRWVIKDGQLVQEK